MDDTANTSATSAQQQSPLSAEQHQQIAAARKRARKVRRAVGVAKFDAWTTAVFACFTLSYVLLSPFIAGFDWVAVMVGGGMALVAFNSFRFANRLRHYDVRAPRLLALNQIFFAAVITAYCLWQIARVMFGWYEPNPAMAQLKADPTVAEVYGDIEEITRIVVPLVYGAVIFGSILVQGSTALYYFTRGRHVREFRRQTPPWIVDLLIAGTV